MQFTMVKKGVHMSQHAVHKIVIIEKEKLILIFLKKYNPQTILNKREYSSQNKYKAVHEVYT